MKLVLTLLATLGLAACPSAPVPVVTPDPPVDEPTAPLTVGGGAARPQYERHQLDNGLEVWLFPDHGAPLAIAARRASMPSTPPSAVSTWWPSSPSVSTSDSRIW